MEEIRQQYVNMRTAVELWDWISMTDLRSSWYMLTHGVGSLIEKPLGNVFQIESVTMFPIGTDGILGEVQIGAIANERPNRWPEVPAREGDVPFPVKRLAGHDPAQRAHGRDPRAGRRPGSSPPCARTSRPRSAATSSTATRWSTLEGAAALRDLLPRRSSSASR